MPQKQVDDKSKKPIPPMPVDSINGVQIFSAGTWNGDEYSVEDLDLMVEAFEANKDHVRPFLKLGHDEEQKLLQVEGLPAAGWVERIYRKGEHLYADFFEIPNKVFQLIERKAYRKVSCEIYCNVEIAGKQYKYLVGAIALLGAETPGVMNLDDLLAMYKVDSFNFYKSQQTPFKSYEFEKTEIQTNQGDEMSKTERELQLEKELADAKTKEAELTAKAEKLEADKKDFAAKATEATAKLFAAEIEAQANELASAKLITPAMRPYVVALLGEEKAKYTVAEKEMTKSEIVKELCKLFEATSKVNLEERSEDGEEGKEKPTTQDAVLEEVEKYAKENKTSFAAAYRVVAKQHEEKLAPKSIEGQE